MKIRRKIKPRFLITLISSCSILTVGIGIANAQLSGISEEDTQQALGLLSSVNVLTNGNLNSNVDIQGRAIVGGNVQNPSSTYGTSNEGMAGVSVLSVVGNINGSPKNINNGGNVVVGGSVNAILNFNGGGQLIEDPGINFDDEKAALLNLSLALSNLPNAGEAQIPDSGGQPGPARLIATPDENGLAVINVEDGSSLFSNNKVQQIEVIPNGAIAVVINVGGNDITFNRGNFVGATTTDAVSSTLLWNFSSASNLVFKRGFEGSVLAPIASLKNTSQIDGAVAVDFLRARGRVGGPLFSGSAALQVEGEPPSGELEVTALNDIQTSGGNIELNLTVLNGTEQNFSDLNILALSASEDITVVDNGVLVGAIATLTETTPQENITISTTRTTPILLEDFTFTFDERVNIEGFDDNQDGIRDDVELVIDRISSNASIRTFGRNLAKETQRLYRATTTVEANAALDEVEESIVCLQDVISDMLEWEQYTNAIDRIIVNTDDRLVAKFDAIDLIVQSRTSRDNPTDAEVANFCAAILNANP